MTLTPRGLVVGLLHPGRMGSAVAAQARRNGHDVLWLPDGRSRSTADRAQAAGLRPTPSLGDLLANSQLVISLCPPAVAESIANDVAAHGFSGLFLEANAISPGRCIAISDMLTHAGATVVDGGIFGPPPTDTVSVRLNLAGAHDAVSVTADIFTGTTVQAVSMTQPAPAASALKMAYSSYQKAARALAAVAHAYAAEYGITDHLIAAGRHNDSSPLTDPEYLTSVAARAWRWAPELRDAAHALRQVGLPPDIAESAATVLDHWADRKNDWQLSLDDVLHDLHQNRTL